MPGDPLFPPSVLLRMAGRRTYDRGAAYAAQEAVDITQRRPDGVRARVHGSARYEVEVLAPGDRGSCTCPAFAREGYCKHIVAAALEANRDPGEGSGTAPGPDVRAFLVAQGAEALADRLLRIASGDRDLRSALEAEAALASGSDAEVLASLRRAVEDATYVAGYVDYRAAKGYAAGVEAVLDRIAPLAEGPRAPVALALATEALDRLAENYEEVDGHDGTLDGLREHAAEIHLSAAERARPDPIALARWLFEEETRSDFETFLGASETYEEVLGDAGLAEYRRLAEEAFAAGEASSGYALHGVLDRIHARAGDVEARIALRRASLDTAYAYVALVEFCIEAGRPEEALHYAEEGLWRFEDGRPDERLVLLCARLQREAGRTEEALARLEAAFAKEPTLSLYRQIRSHGGEAARERALAVFEERAARDKPSAWTRMADTLISALVEDGLHDRAWAAHDSFGGSMPTAERLARACEATHPARAVAVYARRVEQLAEAGSNGAYDEAAALVARMAALRPPAEHEAFLSDLKLRYKRRRNLIARLP